MHLVGRSYIWRVSDKDLGNYRKIYKKPNYKDVQGAVESIFRGWGYLGKRRGSEKVLFATVWVSNHPNLEDKIHLKGGGRIVTSKNFHSFKISKFDLSMQLYVH